MTKDDNNNSKVAWFRFITPILVTIAVVMLGSMERNVNEKFIGINEKIGIISSTVTDIDIKLFKHLTNDEMHSPRSLIVTKPEFLIYQNLRDIQMKDIKDGVNRIFDLMEKHSERDVK